MFGTQIIQMSIQVCKIKMKTLASLRSPWIQVLTGAPGGPGFPGAPGAPIGPWKIKTQSLTNNELIISPVSEYFWKAEEFC